MRFWRGTGKESCVGGTTSRPCGARRRLPRLELDSPRADVSSGRRETRYGAALTAQLAPVAGAASIAVVDDTVFLGLTMGAALRALPPGALARPHAFCLRAVAESLDALRALAPGTAGIAAPGRLRGIRIGGDHEYGS
jgi:hypothetical protein